MPLHIKKKSLMTLSKKNTIKSISLAMLMTKKTPSGTFSTIYFCSDFVHAKLSRSKIFRPSGQCVELGILTDIRLKNYEGKCYSMKPVIAIFLQ